MVFGHKNWDLVMNVMQGLQLAVSRTSAEGNRPISAFDFGTKEKYTLVPGNRLRRKSNGACGTVWGALGFRMPCLPCLPCLPACRACLPAARQKNHRRPLRVVKNGQQRARSSAVALPAVPPLMTNNAPDRPTDR